jgi:uncharacterized membrane protein YhaH (DUF805 family)
MKHYFNAFNNYATFSGRATRSEYWFFVLFNIIFIILAMLLDNAFGTTIKMGYGVSLPYGYIYIAYLIITLLPSFAVGVRRLHDVGKSGWFFLISLIPIIGAIWLLVLLFTDSNVGENKYGESVL